MTTTTVSELRNQILAKSAEDESFRSKLMENPKDMIAKEFGLDVPDGFDIIVHEDSVSKVHLVLPPSHKLSESDLKMASGGGWHRMYWSWEDGGLVIEITND